MPEFAWLFVPSAIRPLKDVLPHDLQDLYYAQERPQLPVLESREGVINEVRQIDHAVALAVRMEDE